MEPKGLSRTAFVLAIVASSALLLAQGKRSSQTGSAQPARPANTRQVQPTPRSSAPQSDRNRSGQRQYPSTARPPQAPKSGAQPRAANPRFRAPPPTAARAPSTAGPRSGIGFGVGSRTITRDPSYRAPNNFGGGRYPAPGAARAFIPAQGCDDGYASRRWKTLLRYKRQALGSGQPGR